MNANQPPDPDDHIVTPDQGQAASTWEITGEKPEPVEISPGRFGYRFISSDKIKQAMADYMAGAKVEAFGIVSKLKAIRGQTNLLKNEIARGDRHGRNFNR